MRKEREMERRGGAIMVVTLAMERGSCVIASSFRFINFISRKFANRIQFANGTKISQTGQNLANGTSRALDGTYVILRLRRCGLERCRVNAWMIYIGKQAAYISTKAVQFSGVSLGIRDPAPAAGI